MSITSYSKDFNRILVKVSSFNAPEQYYFYDQSAGQIALLGEGYPEADKSKMSPVKKFVYVASDGQSITSYLTIPEQWHDDKPLIVLPHGGPELRDSKEFDWQRQYFASNGYAVFQPNFRGSSGYGYTFTKAGFGEWGRRMQQDVDDGVKAVIDKFSINKDKICIVGGSYGGYVAMYAAASANSLYQCAISYAGISELSLIFLHSKEQKKGIAYWQKSIGDNRAFDQLKAYSPLDIATKNALPLLMFHGEKDTIVPPYQSEKMYKKLKEIEAEGMQYIELEGEDHWFTLGSSRKTFLHETLTFVETYL